MTTSAGAICSWCQGTSVLPIGGYETCPWADMNVPAGGHETVHRVAQEREGAGEGLAHPDRVATGLTQVDMMHEPNPSGFRDSQPYDMPNSYGFGAQATDFRWVRASVSPEMSRSRGIGVWDGYRWSLRGAVAAPRPC